MAEGWNRQQPILKLCSSNRSVKKKSKSVPPINSLSYPESHKSVKEKDIKVRKTQSTIPKQLQQSRDRDHIKLRLRAKAQEKDQVQKQLRELVLNIKALKVQPVKKYPIVIIPRPAPMTCDDEEINLDEICQTILSLYIPYLIKQNINKFHRIVEGQRIERVLVNQEFIMLRNVYDYCYNKTEIAKQWKETMPPYYIHFFNLYFPELKHDGYIKVETEQLNFLIPFYSFDKDFQ